MNQSQGVNPLQDLLNLSPAVQVRRGIRFTPGEIARQPDTWQKTGQLVGENRAAIRNFIAETARHKVIFTGAGTSDYIGHCLVPHWRRNGFRHTNAVASTTLLTEHADHIGKDERCLLVSLSRSGESPEGVRLLEMMLEQHPLVRHLVITCNQNGSMAQHANSPQVYCLVLDESTNDQGLAMTASFSNLLLAGQIIAAPDFDLLETLFQAGERMLQVAPGLAEELAAQDFSRACFLGSGPLYGLAQEAALKTMELTAGRIITMAETPLGLRHGPLSALNAQTLLVLFLSQESNRRNYELKLWAEVRKKNLGCTQVLVCNHATEDTTADFVLDYQAPDLPDINRPPVDIIFGQLYGLFAALRFGLQPDSPSPSGAISRVVANI
jgi:tagatose-6-phosphate ketose/aldose isomerase